MAFTCSERRVGQELGLGRVQNPEKQVRLLASAEDFLVLRPLRAEAMPANRSIVRACGLKFAMGAVESSPFRPKNKSVAESFRKLIRRGRVPLNVEDPQARPACP